MVECNSGVIVGLLGMRTRVAKGLHQRERVQHRLIPKGKFRCRTFMVMVALWRLQQFVESRRHTPSSRRSRSRSAASGCDTGCGFRVYWLGQLQDVGSGRLTLIHLALTEDLHERMLPPAEPAGIDQSKTTDPDANELS